MNRVIVVLSAIFLTVLSACKKNEIKDHECIRFDLRSRDKEQWWISENAVNIRSIDPADEDFQDLDPLKEMIGNARIVALGEQSHGDGATFHAKTRLIKFLHQEMGFDVLAFESGIHDCRRAWKRFQAGDAPTVCAAVGLFPLWSASNQVQPLFRYLSKMAGTKKPLELFGIDCQFSGTVVPPGVAEELKSFLDGLGVPVVEKEVWDNAASALSGLRLSFFSPYGQRYQAKEIERKALEILRSKLEAIAKKSIKRSMELAFWTQFLRNAIVMADKSMVDKSVLMPGMQNRDRQMADNLVWLAREYYPNRKIIVWAASFHIMRNPNVIDVPKKSGRKIKYDEFLPMGHLAWKELGDQLFTVGFVAYKGKKGMPWSMKWGAKDIGPAPEGSLEGFFKEAGFEYAFLPLRNLDRDGEWIHKGVLSRPMGYTSMKADWSKVFDAIVFIKEMYPSTMVVSSR